eukprot:3184036-Alexandrium_andersonii.AAC.1
MRASASVADASAAAASVADAGSRAQLAPGQPAPAQSTPRQPGLQRGPQRSLRQHDRHQRGRPGAANAVAAGAKSQVQPAP